VTRKQWVLALVVAVAAAGAVILLVPDRTEAPVTAPSTSALTGAAPAMRAQAIVYRTDQAVGGRFRVKITNTGDEEFEVLGLRLESGGFEPQPLTTDPVRYTPGERTDIVAPFGAARCGTDDTVAPAHVVMDVRVAGGEAQRLEVPLESILEAIPKLHERECDIARIAAAVDVGLASIEQVEAEGGPILEADITFRRLETDEPIVVSDVRGSVLYRIVGDGLPIELAADDAEAVLPIVISPARCDGHALGESKQPFVFPVHIEVGDADGIGYHIPIPTDQQDQLYEYLTTACGLVN